jgi:hypothetical protein
LQEAEAASTFTAVATSSSSPEPSPGPGRPTAPHVQSHVHPIELLAAAYGLVPLFDK